MHNIVVGAFIVALAVVALTVVVFITVAVVAVLVTAISRLALLADADAQLCHAQLCQVCLDLSSGARLVLGRRGNETIRAHPLVELAMPAEEVHQILD